jgi:hypothetical protein
MAQNPHLTTRHGILGNLVDNGFQFSPLIMLNEIGTLIPDVCDLLFVWCALTEILLFGDQRSVIGDQRSVIGDQRSVIGDQRSVIGGQRPVIGDRRPVIET